MEIQKNLFEYGKRYTLDSIVELSGEAGLCIETNYNSNYPNITVLSERGTHFFQLTSVSDEYAALTWTAWDGGE